jgi:hypothetical protein
LIQGSAVNVFLLRRSPATRFLSNAGSARRRFMRSLAAALNPGSVQRIEISTERDFRTFSRLCAPTQQRCTHSVA